jgi:hypothetical protein
MRSIDFTGNINIDCERLYDLLKDYVEPVAYSGTERKTGQFKLAKQGKKIGSMLYGYTWKGYLKRDKETGEMIYRTKSQYDGLYNTKIKDMFPQLDSIFRRFADLHLPNFKYTQVQININFLSPPHFDGANIGESVIVGLGNYVGGKLIVEQEDKIIKQDIHHRPFKFNGSKYKHYVNAVESGDRYTLVFFNNNKLKTF